MLHLPLESAINYASTFAITFIMSLYLQYAKGMSPREAGTVMVVQPVLMVLVSAVSGRMSDRYPARILASAGLFVIIAGLIGLSFTDETSAVSYIVVCLGTLGFGFGLFSSPNTNAIMGSVNRQHLGLASAMSSTMRISGQLISMAMAAMVLNMMIGDTAITADVIPSLVRSSHIIFVSCTVICAFAILASMLAVSKREGGNK